MRGEGKKIDTMTGEKEKKRKEKEKKVGEKRNEIILSRKCNESVREKDAATNYLPWEYAGLIYRLFWVSRAPGSNPLPG